MLHISNIRSIEEYLEILGEEPLIYFDYNELTTATEDCMWIAEKYRRLCSLQLMIESEGRYYAPCKEVIIDHLLDCGIDLEKRYSNRKTKGLSLDRKKVIEPLIKSGVSVDLLTYWNEHQTYSRHLSFLRSLTRVLKINKDKNGNLMGTTPTSVVPQKNLRVYYRDIAVVSVPKVYSHIIRSKSDDYFLAWCDYPQADWRFAYNLFIKDDENFKVMSSCDDAYEGLARLVEGDKFNEQTFKENRSEYKVNCLKVFYNSSDSAEIPTLLREFFMKCDKYRKAINDLWTLREFEVPIRCTSYFGHTEMIDNGRGTIPASFVSESINKPIQTFTSEIIIETVAGILERFWELGYTKDDINVYFVRHDEPIFMCKKTILKDAWVFGDCSRIHVDGFTPINLDFHFGSHYKREDDEITSLVNKSIDENSNRFHDYPLGEMHEFNPFPSVDTISIMKSDKPIEQGYVYTIYSHEDKRYFTITLPISEHSETENENLFKVYNKALASKELYPVEYLKLYFGCQTNIVRFDNTLVKILPQTDYLIFPEEIE